MPEPVRCPACDHVFDAPVAAAPVTELDEQSAAEIASGGENYLSTRSRRGRHSPLAQTLRWLTIAVALVTAVVVIYQTSATGDRREPRRELALGPLPYAPPTIVSPDAAPVDPLLSAEVARPEIMAERPAASVDLLTLIRRGVVVLETEDADGATSLGTGFLLAGNPAESQPPLLVTNYHVLSSATSAYARFQDGSRHAVNGYWAIASDMDLAAVQLASLPVNARSLTLADGLPQIRDEVLSIGHPQGIKFSTYPGEVSQLLDTGELPVSAREYLHASIRGERNLHWIQHTARLSPGNSGGPLLDALGQVVGVNTWTNHEAGFSYALREHHVRELLAAPLLAVAPLSEYTNRKALAAESREQLSARRLLALLAEAEAFGFLPSSAAEYRTLQELALALTYAGRQRAVADNSVRHADREELFQAVDKVASRLRAQKWNAFGTTTLVNDLALEEYRRPLAGVFLFAVADRIVMGDDATRGMLLHIAGSEQEIFIPLDGLLLEPEPKSQCLIVGMNFQGQVVRYGENPLALHEVPVIVTASDGIFELRQ